MYTKNKPVLAVTGKRELLVANKTETKKLVAPKELVNFAIINKHFML